MPINERQISLKSGGDYATLKDYLDRMVCKRTPWIEDNNITPSAVNFVTVLAANIIGTNTIAVSDPGVLATETSGGIIAATATLGTHLTTLVTDTIGNILNLCEIRDATTHAPIKENNRNIYGLLHTNATDGTTHSDTNLQMSFIYIADDGTPTAVNVDQTIEFRFTRSYSARTQGSVTLLDGAVDREIVTAPLPTAFDIQFDNTYTGTTLTSTNLQDVIEELETLIGESSSVEIQVDEYLHTGASLNAEEVLTINTIWTSEPDIPVDYNTNVGWEFFLNGVRLRKGTLASGAEIERIDTTTIRIAYTLDEGDVLEMKEMH